MRFKNPHVCGMQRGFFEVLLWLLGYYHRPDECLEPPAGFYFSEQIYQDDEKLTVKWVTHSTFLIQLDGKTILTDPIWSERASPVQFIGPKRHVLPTISLDELPVVDIVLISHNHYDHLDLHTCRELKKRFPEIRFLVPYGVKSWFQKNVCRQFVEEFVWWENRLFVDLSFTCVPAQHFSGRTLFDRNKTLWCGWVVQSKNRCLYFAGDTGYNPVDFCEIGKKFPSIDVSLIPIGAYAPREFMKPVHVNPSDAVQIHLDVGSKRSIGCHFGTFRLSDETLKCPLYDLHLALKDKNIDASCFQVLKTGRERN